MDPAGQHEGSAYCFQRGCADYPWVGLLLLQNDRTAARREPLVVLAKDIISQYFKLIR